jgi:hypothetical protein
MKTIINQFFGILLFPHERQRQQQQIRKTYRNGDEKSIPYTHFW